MGTPALIPIRARIFWGTADQQRVLFHIIRRYIDSKVKDTVNVHSINWNLARLGK